MTPTQHVTIDELVVEVGPGSHRGDIVRELTRTLTAAGVDRADEVAGAIADDLGRRGALGGPR
jgi:hypothetical protein